MTSDDTHLWTCDWTILETGFYHKGNKQTNFQQTITVFLVGTIQKMKWFKFQRIKKEKDKKWTQLSPVGQEPTFKTDKNQCRIMLFSQPVRIQGSWKTDDFASRVRTLWRARDVWICNKASAFLLRSMLETVAFPKVSFTCFLFCSCLLKFDALTRLLNNPAGTWRRHDVILMSMRRNDFASTSALPHYGAMYYVASTSVRRQYDAMCPLAITPLNYDTSSWLQPCQIKSLAMIKNWYNTYVYLHSGHMT